MKLDRPRLAYLSLCHAASNRENRLLDEGIHLSGACQLAGFQHVIGTLWQVNDRYSVQVSSDVYSSVCAEGDLDFGNVAEGLHKAIRRLRAMVTEDGIHRDLRNEPLVWAPYIHLGG